MTNMLTTRLHATLLAPRIPILSTIQLMEATEIRPHEAAERVGIYLVAEVVAGDAIFAVDEGGGEVVGLCGGAEGEEDEGGEKLHGVVEVMAVVL